MEDQEIKMTLHVNRVHNSIILGSLKLLSFNSIIQIKLRDFMQMFPQSSNLILELKKTEKLEVHRERTNQKTLTETR